jgi:hypothetical protein
MGEFGGKKRIGGKKRRIGGTMVVTVRIDSSRAGHRQDQLLIESEA